MIIPLSAIGPAGHLPHGRLLFTAVQKKPRRINDQAAICGSSGYLLYNRLYIVFRLKLLNRRYEKFCAGNHGVGLFFRVILAKGNKIDILGIQKQADIFHIHSQRVIGGDGYEQRFIVSEMCLAAMRQVYL